jgi:hypothetical protein
MKAVYAIAAIAIASPALAEPTSEEYAMMARKTFSAWACFSLADYTSNVAEAERLFTLGYESGKAVVEAVKAGKVKREDWSKHAPWIFGSMMGGATDFALGRMFETVMADTVKKLWKETTTQEDRQFKADTLYRNQNCSLLR